MNASKANIRFNYLYRDAGNYKNFGSVVFSNPNRLSPITLEKSIKSSLIDAEFFNHKKVKVPALFFFPNNSNDHFWHEFENVEVTNDTPTDIRTIDEFLVSLDSNPKVGYEFNSAI